MKMNKIASLVVFTVLLLGLQGCLKDSCERTITYTRLDPVFVTLDEIRSSKAEFEAPRALENPGAIYYYNNKIYVGERSAGIHVIDNSDPSNPTPINFIAIPGNESFAIKNGILYASNYVDLLAINLANNQTVGRTQNVFPALWEDLQNNRIAVSYVENEVTEELDCDSYTIYYQSEDGRFFDIAADGFFAGNAEILTNSIGGAENSNSNSGTGIGGSMARFTIVGDYLYAIDQYSMDVFSLSDPQQPVAVSTVEIGWGIETIFPYQDKLFIGSVSGMFIYDNSNPAAPSLLSSFQHARACDPVFVKDNYAYVTLRSGNTCDGFINQLDLVDITDLANPVLKKTFPMQNPHGLSIANDNLFLCEGEFGLKSFDITDPTVLGSHQLDHETDLHAFDAISLNWDSKLLLVIGEGGFFQYDFENPSDLKLLSKISINN